MLECSNSRCEIKWFHDDCVGEPAEMWDPSIQWKCPDCVSSSSKGEGKGKEKSRKNRKGGMKKA